MNYLFYASGQPISTEVLIPFTNNIDFLDSGRYNMLIFVNLPTAFEDIQYRINSDIRELEPEPEPEPEPEEEEEEEPEEE
mgnify:CR=1 FL=1